MKNSDLQRLDKIIASQTGASRSDARKGIRFGKALVNGKAVRDPAEQFDPNAAEIVYRGQALSYKKHTYILINKPKGVLSASSDKSRQTVIDLLPQHLKRANLAPVGRLDKDTTGLLIITDDGEFAHKVISPKSNILKTYKVTLDGTLTKEMTEQFANGIILADGTACRPAELEIIGERIACVRISEGKYHQIKRMFGVVGLGVNELERIAVGSLKLPDDLPYGQAIELSEEQKKDIFQQ